MTIWKKAISVATSAALLASLLTAAVAPAALAAITQTSAGPVAQGTTSAGTATITFTENGINALTTTGTMTVAIAPAAPAAGTVSWAGTPVVSAPGSLGVGVSIVGGVLNISIAGFDPANVETIAISGLRVTASATASPGAVVATLGGVAGIIAAFAPATTTVSGTLATPVGVGVSVGVQVSGITAACGFNTTNSISLGGVESRTATAVGALSGGVQVIDLPAGPNAHAIGTTVTSTVPWCGLASPATVALAAAFSSDGNPTVYPGEANSRAAALWVDEPAIGFLAAGTTLTFSIVTPGVVFSRAPSLWNDGAGLTLSGPVLAADRRSVTVTVSTASTGVGADIELGNILYDVGAAVPGGTFIQVSLALSGGLFVSGSPASNAVVFRGISASAPTPTVWIGENNQPTGLVTLTEQAAGFFHGGIGANNVISVCTTGVDYEFTFAPWARVTGGDLRLREGAVASPDNIVVGSQDGSCFEWTVWTASTVASTIQIGSSTFATGPLINVQTDQVPGVVALNIFSGDGTVIAERIAVVGFAVAAFRTQVAVSALSQPVIPAGAKSRVGAIQISETAPGQLKRWEAICVEILPRATLGFLRQDVFMQALTTADLPVVTATGGLVVGPMEWSDGDCEGRQENGPSFGSGTHMVSFSFDVLQQSTTGAGRLVIDNINVITTADAPQGPVLFNVYGFGGHPTHVTFQSTISPARIGVRPAITIRSATALGRTMVGPFTTPTKTAALNRFITWRFTGGSALAGKRVQIWVATRNVDGSWGAWSRLTGRTADGAGNVFFWWRSDSARRISVRAFYPGDATHRASWSPSGSQGVWR
ncbi:MAG TPA: hypothetical protein VLM76_08595 [Patescibacteria group bacterium]|nr:hypothetical protein [Patescibacteria group bacterium]